MVLFESTLTRKTETMNEDSILLTIRPYLAYVSDSNADDIHLNTSFETDLGVDDEIFEFFLIDLQDAEPSMPDLTGLALRDFPTLIDLIDTIESLIVP